MRKINIVQFLPYFPPHKWWLETVAEELSYFYVKNNFWEVINIIFDGGQDISRIDPKKLIKNKKQKIIWYHNNWYKVYLLPSFDIISNFPVPKFWKKIFWEILFLHELRNWIIQTHTRFFLSSFLWWLFAKYHKLKWVHVEHGSDYVKLSSEFQSKIAYWYDRVIGKWIFKKADSIVAISNVSKEFINKNFTNRDINVIYNWILFNETQIEKKWTIKLVFIGRLVKLKWIEFLLEVYKNILNKYNELDLYILWDWNEYEYVKNFIIKNSLNNVHLLWYKDNSYIMNFLSKNECLIIMPSIQEWLWKVALEWLISKNVVIWSDAWWIKEISDKDDLIIFKSRNILKLKEAIIIWMKNYDNLSWLSYNYVKAKFDWNKSIRKYFSLYSNLIKK